MCIDFTNVKVFKKGTTGVEALLCFVLVKQIIVKCFFFFSIRRIFGESFVPKWKQSYK